MANTYNTGNDLGSSDPRDTYDNASNFDEFVNSASASFTNRFGIETPTRAGIADELSKYNDTGDWVASTAYDTNDLWTNTVDGDIYQVIKPYTSGADEASDIAAGNAVIFRKSSRPANILWDPLNEVLIDDDNFGGNQWLAATPYSIATSANTPYDTPAIVSSNVNTTRVWPFAAVGIKPAETITATIGVYFENAGGTIQIIFGDGPLVGTALASASTGPTAASGYAEYSLSLAAPASGTQSFGVRVTQPGGGGSYEIAKCVAAIGTVPADVSRPVYGTAFTDSALATYDNSTSGLAADNVQSAIDEVEARVDTLEEPRPVNINPDPFSQYALVDRLYGGPRRLPDPEVAGLEWEVRGVPVHSPFGDDTVLSAIGMKAGGTKISRYVYLPEIGVEVGDTVTMSLVCYIENAGASVTLTPRTAGFTPGTSVNFSGVSSGLQTLAITYVIPGATAYLDVSITPVSGDAEIYGVFLAEGTRQPGFNNVDVPNAGSVAIDSIGAVVYNGVAITDGSRPAQHFFEGSTWIEYVSDGVHYRVLKTGGASIAVPPRGEVTIVLGSGQSLSVGLGTDSGDVSPAVNSFPENNLMMGPVNSVGPLSLAYAAEDYTGFTACSNGANRDSYGLSAIEFAMRLHGKAANTLPTTVWCSHGFDGRNIEELSATSGFGLVYYNNGIAQATRVVELASLYGLTVSSEVYMLWVQGESDASNASYVSDLIALYDQYLADLQSIIGTGVRLHWIMDQITRVDISTVITRQQLLANDERNIYLTGNKTSLCNRLYRALEYTGGSDFVHLTKAGYWLQGALFGQDLYNVMTIGRTELFKPTKVSRAGDTITLEFDNSGPKIKQNTDLQNASYPLGFSYTDSGAAISVASAEIVGDYTVVVTLSGDPSGNTGRTLSHGKMPSTTYPEYGAVELVKETDLYIPEIGDEAYLPAPISPVYLDRFCVGFDVTV